MTRVLVTGGAGFIGSHLVDRLLEEGYLVTVVDGKPRGRAGNLEDALLSSRCELIQLNLLDPHLADVVLSRNPQIVYHLAAQVSVRQSVMDPIHDARTNILGTLMLLEACVKAEVQKVLFASSVAIYGDAEVLPVTEQTPPQPLSPYAVSKLTGEHYLRQFQNLHGLNSTTLVMSNVYGPRQNPGGEVGVVAIFADAMAHGKPTAIYGDGSNTRDYVYVGDVVDAFVRASAPKANGMRLNVGTGVATSDLELHRLVAKASGSGQEPTFMPARPGDIRHMLVDASNASRVLEWKAGTTLDGGLDRVADIRPPH